MTRDHELMIRLVFTTAIFVSIVACGLPLPEAPTLLRSSQTIHNYCDLYQCEPCPSTGCPPGGEELMFCCHPRTGVCAQTSKLSDCDPDDYAVVCNWGQNNVDGSITCYD